MGPAHGRPIVVRNDPERVEDSGDSKLRWARLPGFDLTDHIRGVADDLAELRLRPRLLFAVLADPLAEGQARINSIHSGVL
jgi:hypothetical protein